MVSAAPNLIERFGEVSVQTPFVKNSPGYIKLAVNEGSIEYDQDVLAVTRAVGEPKVTVWAPYPRL